MSLGRVAAALALVATACGPFAPGDDPPPAATSAPVLALLAYGGFDGGYVKDLGGTRPGVRPTDGQVGDVEWSADGRYVAFLRSLPGSLVVHDVSAGTTATWTPPHDEQAHEVYATSRGFAVLEGRTLYHVAPDGSAEAVPVRGVPAGPLSLRDALGDRLFAQASTSGKGPAAFYELGLDGSARRLFSDGEGTGHGRDSVISGFAVTADGGRYVYATSDAATGQGANPCQVRYTVVVRDAATGRELPIPPPVSGDHLGSFDVGRTSDGRVLAYASKDLYFCVGTQPAGAYALDGDRWRKAGDAARWLDTAADGREAVLDAEFTLVVGDTRIPHVEVAAWQPSPR